LTTSPKPQRKRRILAATLVGSMTVLGSCSQNGSSPLGGEKQSLGTLIGGITGGLLGSRVGHGTGSVAAAGAGVLLGAALGNYLGAKLDARDKEAASHAVSEALNKPSASPVAWNNAQSGNRGTIVAKPVQYETRAQGAAPAITPPPDNPTAVDPIWVAPDGAKLRAGPSVNTATVGHLGAGRRFEVAGKVPDADWLVVTQRGRPVGYVSTTVVKSASATASPTPAPAQQVAAATPVAPVPETPAPAETAPSGEPTLASRHVAGKPGDTGAPALDQWRPGQSESRAEGMAGSSTASVADPNAIELGGTGHTARVACRTIVSTVNLQGQTQPEVTESKACQQPDGSWAPANS
jgi:surface antigen